MAKELAIDLGLVKVFELKEIGWLGGRGVVFPERDLIKEKSFEGFEEWSALEIVDSHLWRL